MVTSGSRFPFGRGVTLLAKLYEARAETPPKVEGGETRFPLGFEPAGFALRCEHVAQHVRLTTLGTLHRPGSMPVVEPDHGALARVDSAVLPANGPAVVELHEGANDGLEASFLPASFALVGPGLRGLLRLADDYCLDLCGDDLQCHSCTPHRRIPFACGSSGPAPSQLHHWPYLLRRTPRVGR